MQFDDPKSVLEAAAAKPERGVDPHELVKKGRRLRRARYAAVAAGLAVTIAGASASVGLITRRDRPRPAGAACEASERSVSVFVRAGTSDADVARLRTRLEEDPGVERVDYVSPEETLEMLEELSPGAPIPGPNVVPAQLEVLAVDEAAADRIVAMKGGVIDEAVRGMGDRALDCYRERYCGMEIPLEASIFLRDGASDEDVADLQARVLTIPGIGEVRYVSKRDAYREFKRLYTDQPHLYETISASNLPASLRVTAESEAALQVLAETTSPAIDEIRWGGEFMERLCRGVEVTERETQEPPETETPAPATPDPVAEVALLSQECGPNLSGLGPARFSDGDPGTWCRFVLRVENQGEVPFELDARLGSKIAVRRPQQITTAPGTPYFDPVLPGTWSPARLVFLIREDEPVVALEIEITDGLRPIQFEVSGTCAADDTQERPGGCYREYEFPPAYLIRGDIFEGTAEVELYHCGVMPIGFDKRSWVADPPPFDATNAPEEFVGRGRMITELGSLSATYVDESGVSFEVEAVEDWEQPICN